MDNTFEDLINRLEMFKTCQIGDELAWESSSSWPFDSESEAGGKDIITQINHGDWEHPFDFKNAGKLSLNCLQRAKPEMVITREEIDRLIELKIIPEYDIEDLDVLVWRNIVLTGYIAWDLRSPNEWCFGIYRKDRPITVEQAIMVLMKSQSIQKILGL